MEQFLERFAKVPTVRKLLGLLLVLAGIAVVYYQFWWVDYEEKVAGYVAQIADLQRRKGEMDKVREDVRKYEKEIERLEADKKELENQLPQDKAVAALIEAFENEAKLIGITVDGIKPEGEVVGDIYAEIPVELKLTGSYHGILKFFDRVGRLPRIVNIGKINLEDATISDAGVSLKGSCVATTFRYLKPEERATPAPAAPAAAPSPPRKSSGEEGG